MSKMKSVGYESACVAVIPRYRPMTYHMVWPDDEDGGGPFLAKAAIYNINAAWRPRVVAITIEQATL